MNLIKEECSILWGIKSQAITKLFDRFINRRVKLWNDEEIITTLIAPGTIRTAAGRNIWNKILGKPVSRNL